jgi:hypothetical protein
MTAWLNIVKKHAKMNKGKSLKEYLPDAKKEYDMLKKSGKIQLKGTYSKKSKKTKSFKKRGKSKKYTRRRKQRGGEDDVIVTDQDAGMEGGKRGKRSRKGRKGRKGGKRTRSMKGGGSLADSAAPINESM